MLSHSSSNSFKIINSDGSCLTGYFSRSGKGWTPNLRKWPKHVSHCSAVSPFRASLRDELFAVFKIPFSRFRISFFIPSASSIISICVFSLRYIPPYIHFYAYFKISLLLFWLKTCIASTVVFRRSFLRKSRIHARPQCSSTLKTLFGSFSPFVSPSRRICSSLS